MGDGSRNHMLPSSRHFMIELRFVEDMSIKHTSISTDELVVSINRSREDHREEALVLVVQGATVGKFPHGHMLAIYTVRHKKLHPSYRYNNFAKLCRRLTMIIFGMHMRISHFLPF